MKFDYCSVCKKKIGWFRKLRGDTSCFGFIPSNQFCSNKCFDKGLELMLKQLDKKRGKR